VAEFELNRRVWVWYSGDTLKYDKKGERKMENTTVLEKFLGLEFPGRKFNKEQFDFLLGYSIKEPRDTERTLIDRLYGKSVFKSVDDFYQNNRDVELAKIRLQGLRNKYSTPARRNGFRSFKNFVDWWCNQEGKCCYCEVDEKVSMAAFEKEHITSKKTAWKNGILQIERENAGGEYIPENCKLACVLCNNAKSDMISAVDFEKFFADATKNYWDFIKAKLDGVDTKINLCDTCVHTFAECDSNPKFGDGIGNDNVYECDKYEEALIHK